MFRATLSLVFAVSSAMAIALYLGAGRYDHTSLRAIALAVPVLRGHARSALHGLGWPIVLLSGVIAASLYWALQLALDGRYRALWLPWPWACAWVLAWRAVIRGHDTTATHASMASASVMSMALASLGLAAALWVLVQEGTANTEAVWLLAMHGLWLLGCWCGHPRGLHGTRQGEGADANAESNAGVSSWSRPSD